MNQLRHGGGSPNEDELDLEDMDLVRDGDKAAFERLRVRHEQLVRNVCSKHVPAGSSLVDDACQETWHKVWADRTWRRSKAKNGFKGWLATIAANTAKNIRRDQRRQAEGRSRDSVAMGRKIDAGEVFVSHLQRRDERARQIVLEYYFSSLFDDKYQLQLDELKGLLLETCRNCRPSPELAVIMYNDFALQYETAARGPNRDKEVPTFANVAQRIGVSWRLVSATCVKYRQEVMPHR